MAGHCGSQTIIAQEGTNPANILALTGLAFADVQF